MSPILTSAVINISKKYAFEIGKKILHEFKDSATGKSIGKLICYRKQENYNNVLLFIHGFSGSPTETFGDTPDMLINTPGLEGWDIFSIGYSSDIFPAIGKGLWSVNPDITKISLYLKTLLEFQFGDYARVAFVAHSMGGLAVQRCVLDLSEEERKRISHVLLFGTPSAGLRKARWFNFWNLQTRDLSDTSTFITNLRSDWTSRFSPGTTFEFKTIAGSKDDFVPVRVFLGAF